MNRIDEVLAEARSVLGHPPEADAKTTKLFEAWLQGDYSGEQDVSYSISKLKLR
jgi:hypothetical protein